MGRKRLGFCFYVSPVFGSATDIVTRHTLTFRTEEAAAIVELRLPGKGERTWQCDPTRPAIENLLDAGVLQDAINDYESDEGEVRVISAVVS